MESDPLDLDDIEHWPQSNLQIYSASYPSRVFKGMKMGGRMGCVRITTKNLKVSRIDAGSGLILLRGSVPGPKNGFVIIHGL